MGIVAYYGLQGEGVVWLNGAVSDLLLTFRVANHWGRWYVCGLAMRVQLFAIERAMDNAQRYHYSSCQSADCEALLLVTTLTHLGPKQRYSKYPDLYRYLYTCMDLIHARLSGSFFR